MGKQYLVLRIAKEIGSAALSLVPLGGMLDLGTAEDFMRRAVQAEPESLFTIQEVGVA